MKVITKGARQHERKPIPFWEALIKSERVLNGTVEEEWLDDAERRLRDVLSLVVPEPLLLGYSAERMGTGLTLYTITKNEIKKLDIGLLSAGEWPGWEKIVDAVPEFDGAQVVFDALSRYEWFRRWDMQIQRHRIQAEYGIFG